MNEQPLSADTTIFIQLITMRKAFPNMTHTGNHLNIEFIDLATLRGSGGQFLFAPPTLCDSRGIIDTTDMWHAL